MRTLARFAVVVPLLVGGCDTTTMTVDAGIPDLTGLGKCGPNETLTNGVCVNNGSGGLTCGPNTVAADGGVCVVAASACAATGTVLDPVTGTCTKVSSGVPVNNGSHNFVHGFNHIYYDAGAGTFMPVGSTNMQVANVPDATLLFNKAGAPLGGKLITLAYPAGTPAAMFTAFGTACTSANNSVSCMVDPAAQLTLGNWKACSGTASWFKGPFGGKNVYKVVVDIAGCIPNALYTVWTFTSPDGSRANAVTSAPAGGLPNLMQTDVSGAGHFETLEDPKIWFVPGLQVPYSGAHAEPATVSNSVPDGGTDKNAAMTLVFWHSNAETNPMAEFCFATDPTKPLDPATNPCKTPPDGTVNIGRGGVDSHTQLLDEPGTLLSDLAPY